MVNENLIPKTETVYELKSEIPTYEEFLRNYKVDERVKNSYESEINTYNELGRGYGPCSYSGCPYGSSFYLKIGFSQDGLFNYHFREGGYQFEWITCENIEAARAAMRKLYDGTCTVVDSFGNSNTVRAGNKKADALLGFQFYMTDHENRGLTVDKVMDLNYESVNLFKDEGGCSIN